MSLRPLPSAADLRITIGEVTADVLGDRVQVDAAAAERTGTLGAIALLARELDLPVPRAPGAAPRRSGRSEAPPRKPEVRILADSAEQVEAYVAWRWPDAATRPPLRKNIVRMEDPPDVIRRVREFVEEGEVPENVLCLPVDVAEGNVLVEDMAPHPGLRLVAAAGSSTDFVDLPALDDRKPDDPSPW